MYSRHGPSMEIHGNGTWMHYLVSGSINLRICFIFCVMFLFIFIHSLNSVVEGRKNISYFLVPHTSYFENLVSLICAGQNIWWKVVKFLACQGIWLCILNAIAPALLPCEKKNRRGGQGNEVLKELVSSGLNIQHAKWV
jgi:hypothetical protein